MEKVVISIGGSILVPNENDAEYIKKLADLLVKLSDQYKLYIVTGGGKIARYYISTGRAIGSDEKSLDELGIEATRLNARLLISALGKNANPLPALDIDSAHEYGNLYDIVIMGGTKPGHTTDAVSAMLAVKVGAVRLINATAVDGIYDSDPKKNPEAKRYSKTSYEQLNALVSHSIGKAGPTVIFDPLGAEIIAEKKIVLCVCKGRDLTAMENAISGNKFHGTIVK